MILAFTLLLGVMSALPQDKPAIASVTVEPSKEVILTPEQRESRVEILRISDQWRTRIERHTKLIKNVRVRGKVFRVVAGGKDVGSCEEAGVIHISKTLDDISARHVLWHELKHACMSSCVYSRETSNGAWRDIPENDRQIEPTVACELNILRDNPSLVKWLTKKVQP